MATFKVHEDKEIKNLIHNDNNKDVKISRKRFALQSLKKNETKCLGKRVKLSDTNNSVLLVDKISKSTKQLDELIEKKDNVLDDVVQQLNLEPLSLIENKEEDDKKTISLFKETMLDNREYSKDIWNYLFELEENMEWPKINYMRKQVHLNFRMRSILVDWLVSVAEEYEINEQTLHLAVNFIDRFLSHMSVVKSKFQLLGAAAMMIASKLEEIYPPSAKEWTYLTQDSYTINQISQMEQLLVKVLRYELQPPTTHTYIQHLCVEHNIDKKTQFLAMYLSELVLLEGEDYLEYLPSQLSASAVALARLTLSTKEPWPKDIKKSTGFSLKELSPVIERQNKTFQESPTHSLQAVQSKYKNERYHKVALIKPKKIVLSDLYD